MKVIRSGLQRHFIKTKNVDIINEDTFRESNTCFENVLRQITSSGKGGTTYYPKIEPEDLIRLYSIGIFEKVWFDIMFQLVRRGRENFRSMTKSPFTVDIDSIGKRFVHQTKSELDKNHNINDNTFDTIGEGRIYETNHPSCPVASLFKYIEHLHPDLDALNQK